MLIGYARISTDTQVLDQQIDALLKYGIDERNIYKEQISTCVKSRPILTHMLKFLRKGDTLIVCKLDRLGRNLAHLLKMIANFEKKEINFVSLSEKIDTTTAVGKMQFHIIGTFAEFERNLISERTRDAVQAAKRRGQKLGRPFALDKEKKYLVECLLREGKSQRSIAKMMGLKSTTPIYNYLKENK